MPTSFLRSTIDVTGPLITRLSNIRACSDHHLKKVVSHRWWRSQDQFDMANYRLITNLSTISKIPEKLAMHCHVMSIGRFSECQSAYYLGHSTETALLKVVSVVTSACDWQTTVLLSLDMSDVVHRRKYGAFTTSQLYIWRATGQYARTVALRHIHFTDKQHYCSTWSLLPSIRWDTQLYMSVRPRCATDPFRTLSLCRRRLSVVSWEQTTAEPIKDWSCSFRHTYSASNSSNIGRHRRSGDIRSLSCQVKLLGVTLDSWTATSPRLSAAATITYGHCGISDRYWRPMSPRSWHTAH